ncbi:hypothetical protein C8J56DRAFT_902779 [Mycena floridula]|nr:hypothetical protein C8J56DRAFT_902779 [Mycena floridula]
MPPEKAKRKVIMELPKLAEILSKEKPHASTGPPSTINPAIGNLSKTLRHSTQSNIASQEDRSGLSGSQVAIAGLCRGGGGGNGFLAASAWLWVIVLPPLTGASKRPLKIGFLPTEGLIEQLNYCCTHGVPSQFLDFPGFLARFCTLSKYINIIVYGCKQPWLTSSFVALASEGFVQIIAEWKAQQAKQAAEGSAIVEPSLQYHSSVPAADNATNALTEVHYQIEIPGQEPQYQWSDHPQPGLSRNSASLYARMEVVDNDGEAIWVRLAAGSYCPVLSKTDHKLAAGWQKDKAARADESVSGEEFKVSGSEDSEESTSEEEYSGNRKSTRRKLKSNTVKSSTQTENQAQMGQILEDQSVEILAHGGQTFDIEKFAEQIGEKKAVKISQSEEDMCKLFGVGVAKLFKTWWSFTEAAEKGAKTKEEIAEQMVPILEALEAMERSDDRHLTIGSRFKSATSKLDALSAIFCGSDILPEVLAAEGIDTKVLLHDVTTKLCGTKSREKSKQVAGEVAQQIMKAQLIACGIPVNVNIKWKILVKELHHVGETLKGWTCYNNIPGHAFKGMAAIDTKAWEVLLASLQNKQASVEFWSEADKALDEADEAYGQIILVSGAYPNYEALVRVCDLNHNTQEPQNKQGQEQPENIEALPDTMYGRAQTPDREPHPALGIAQPSDHPGGFSPSPVLQSESGFQYRLHHSERICRKEVYPFCRPRLSKSSTTSWKCQAQ